MRRHVVILGIALALSACGKKPELEPLEDSGKYRSKAEVERMFAEKAAISNSTYEEPPNKSFTYDGSLVMKTIKRGSTVILKGENAGLWVKEDMSGTVNAGSTASVLRFSGKVTGTVTVGGGVVWLEQLPDKQTLLLLRMEFKKPTVIVLNSATRDQLKQLQGCFTGGPLEAVVFESDVEPGRWKTPWGRGGEDAEVRGITKLTVFSRLPEAPK